MRGFKVLQTTCENLQRKLADYEEKIHSGEEAHATLEEKVYDRERAYAALKEQSQITEACYTEIVLKLTNQISEMEEKIRLDEASCVALVLQMEEKLRVSDAACSELANRMEECEQTLKGSESVGLATLVMDSID